MSSKKFFFLKLLTHRMSVNKEKVIKLILIGESGVGLLEIVMNGR